MANTNSQVSTSYEVVEVCKEVLILIFNLVIFLFKLIYYTLEEFYYKVNPKPEKSVKGEIVLITGTGHGMGRELALIYASQGATVIGVDINAKTNEQTIKEIAKKRYAKAHAYSCDVSNRDEVQRLATKIKQDVGDVTILINNAGIMPTHPLLEHTADEIQKIMNINIMAHFWLLEAFLPSMKKNNHGHIVSLSSMAGIMGCRNLVPYCASKFAVRGLMEALYEELRIDPKNNIKLTIICPYMVDTGLCKKPRIKFPHIMKMITPEDAAKEIVKAQRSEELEITLPRYMMATNNIGRMMPLKASFALLDIVETFVDSDL